MTFITQILCFILWLGIVPLCTGVIPVQVFGKKPRNFGTTYLLGWMTMMAVFELVAVPFIVEKRTLTDLSFLFSAIMTVLSLGGIILFIISLGKDTFTSCYELPRLWGNKKSEIVTWIVFAVVVLSQLVMSLIYMTPDGDDSYYLTQSVIADVKDNMYREEPYTGVISDLKLRYFMAPFSMFTAFMARKSGLHAAIVAHTIFPICLIPVTYLIYYKIANCLFEKHREKVAVFMTLIACIQTFGAASYYTNETFLLTRTWQGKSVLANIIIPFAFYLILLICKATEREKRVNVELSGVMVALFITNIAGTLMSTLWLFIMPIYELTLLIVIAVRNKKVWLPFAALLAILPCYLYMLIYGMKYM